MRTGPKLRAGCIGYPVWLGLLIVPMYVLRSEHPWWLLLGLCGAVIWVLVDAFRYYQRIQRPDGGADDSTEP